MSTYQAEIHKIEKFIPDAIDRLFENYGEIMLSLDLTQVVTSIMSRVRLNAGAERIDNKPLAFDVVCKAFVGLLDEGRLRVKPFGFSVLALEELRELRNSFPDATQPQPVSIEPEREPTAAEVYADVINDWQTLPTSKLNALRLNATWRARFDEANLLGLIK